MTKLLDKIKEWKQQILESKDRLEAENSVISNYGEMFNPQNLNSLTREDFKSFLLMKNNKHWDGIHRQGSVITQNMDRLRKALGILLDEGTDIAKRLDLLFPKGKDNYIKGLGRAVVTPILLVVYPDKYGVWNTKSEIGLKKLGLFPNIRGNSFGTAYKKINNVLLDLSKRYDVSLWKLDEIVGWLTLGNPLIGEKAIAETSEIEKTPKDIEDLVNFGLEQHLEDFLIYNWEKTGFGKEYKLIVDEDGNIVSQQYHTDIGNIDILATDKQSKDYVVIELKKGRGSDTIVGQLLRYMGWVKKNLAKGHSVKGIIVTAEDDEKIKYALENVDNVMFYTYKVAFNLKQVI